jgi:hypothetical protein
LIYLLGSRDKARQQKRESSDGGLPPFLHRRVMAALAGVSSAAGAFKDYLKCPATPQEQREEQKDRAMEERGMKERVWDCVRRDK